MRPGAPFLRPLVVAGDSSSLSVFPLPSDPSASMLTSSSSVATAAAKQKGHALLGRLQQQAQHLAMLTAWGAGAGLKPASQSPAPPEQTHCCTTESMDMGSLFMAFHLSI